MAEGKERERREERTGGRKEGKMKDRVNFVCLLLFKRGRKKSERVKEEEEGRRRRR